MKPQFLVNFLACSMLSLLHNLFSQLNPFFKVKINSNTFLQSFMFKNNDDSLKIVKLWELSPTWRPAQSGISKNIPLIATVELVSQQDILLGQTRKWKQFLVCYAGHIPYAVCKGLVQPLLQASNDTLF